MGKPKHIILGALGVTTNKNIISCGTIGSIRVGPFDAEGVGLSIVVKLSDKRFLSRAEFFKFLSRINIFLHGLE